MLDETEVLNNQPDSPVQQDVEPVPEVLNQVTQSSPNKNMYTSAVRPIQEKNHADEIASNVLSSQENANATFNTQSPGEQKYDTTVKTTTTMSNAAPLEGTFEAKLEMNDAYKYDDNAEYSWNTLARKQANLEYKQQ